MRSFSKFVLLADVDNARISPDELKKIIQKVEAVGDIIYIKLYGLADRKLKEFSEIINGRCCDVAPVLRGKQKSRKSLLDIRIIVDAVKLAERGAADSFAIIAGEGDYGYMLSALKAMGKFIAGKFASGINQSFLDMYLGDQPDVSQLY